MDQPFALQRQTFLFDLLRDQDAEDYLATLGAATAFVHEWRRGNRLWPNGNQFAWSDDPVSNRLQAQIFLMDQLRANKLTSTNDEQAFLESLVQHAGKLMDERLYIRRTNHGMMQNAALLSVALGYPELDRQGRWRQTALQRTERFVLENVSKGGVSLELAPDYHWFVSVQLLWFVASCRQEGVSVSPRVEEAVRGMLAFCRELLQPDRSLPMIADSRGERRSLANWPLDDLPPWPEIAALRSAVMDSSRMPNEPGVCPKPDAGLFILRTGAPEWNAESAMMVVFKTGSQSRAHSHHDALSISLYGNGRPLLTGPGYPDYEPGTDREDIIGTVNQNTVSVDGQSQMLCHATTRLLDLKASEEPASECIDFVAIQADAETYPGVRHRRTLFYGPSRSGILIVDELTSEVQREYHQNFRLAPGCVGQIVTDTLQIGARSGGHPLLRIQAQIVDRDGARRPRVGLRGAAASFHATGRCAAFVTLLEVGDTQQFPVLDAAKRTIRWSGPRGEFSVVLPVDSGSRVLWRKTADRRSAESRQGARRSHSCGPNSLTCEPFKSRV